MSTMVRGQNKRKAQGKLREPPDEMRTGERSSPANKIHGGAITLVQIVTKDTSQQIRTERRRNHDISMMIETLIPKRANPATLPLLPRNDEAKAENPLPICPDL